VNFVSLAIEGAFGVISATHVDVRGSLTRVWDTDSLLGSFDLIQSSIVLNPKPGTLRGLHFQRSPFSENKLVECVSGKVFDVIVDLREESKTYRQHLGLNLGPSENYLGIFVPAGCAHGYLTLEENSTLIYFMDREYSPENAQGLYWNDPILSINWPSEPTLVSDRDSKWPALSRL
jgi:dTDP-4-dehydrorhamnose 3,5-epimerase